jgi:hypothetical protein
LVVVAQELAAEAAAISPLAVAALRQGLRVARSAKMAASARGAVAAYVAAAWGALLQQRQEPRWRLALAGLLRQLLLAELGAEGRGPLLVLPACARPLESLWLFARAACAAGPAAGGAGAGGAPAAKRRKLAGGGGSSSMAGDAAWLAELQFSYEAGSQQEEQQPPAALVQALAEAFLAQAGAGQALGEGAAAAAAAELAAACAAHCLDLSDLPPAMQGLLAALPGGVLQPLAAHPQLLLRSALRCEQLCHSLGVQHAFQRALQHARPGALGPVVQAALFWLPGCTSEQQAAVAFHSLQMCLLPGSSSGAAAAADLAAVQQVCTDEQLRRSCRAALAGPGAGGAAATSQQSAVALLQLQLLGQLRSAGVGPEQLGSWSCWVGGWAPGLAPAPAPLAASAALGSCCTCVC